MKNVFLFVLSRENKTLPLAELEAVLDSESDCELLERVENLVLFRTSRSGKRFLNSLKDRLAMTSSIFRFIGIGETKYIDKFVKNLQVKIENPFRVRVHFYSKREKRRTEEIERHIADLLCQRLKESGVEPKVDLKQPKTPLEFFIVKDRVLSGLKLQELDKKQFTERSPTKRPFFRPVSLDPKIARTMVNLARVGKGRLLDPFCGTGGILIEAGLMGFKIYGVDKNKEMVLGAVTNLKHFRLYGQIEQGDAMELDKLFGKNFFDCIVTTPPYGRLSSLGRTEINILYQRSLESIEKVLKVSGHVVIATPTNINLKTKMQLIEIHRDRLNKSLERKITVFRK